MSTEPFPDHAVGISHNKQSTFDDLEAFPTPISILDVNVEEEALAKIAQLEEENRQLKLEVSFVLQHGYESRLHSFDGPVFIDLVPIKMRLERQLLHIQDLMHGWETPIEIAIPIAAESNKMIDAGGSVLTSNIGHVAIHLGRLKFPKGGFFWKAAFEIVEQIQNIPHSAMDPRLTFCALNIIPDDSLPSDELHLCLADGTLVGKVYNIAPTPQVPSVEEQLRKNGDFTDFTEENQ